MMMREHFNFVNALIQPVTDIKDRFLRVIDYGQCKDAKFRAVILMEAGGVYSRYTMLLWESAA